MFTGLVEGLGRLERVVEENERTHHDDRMAGLIQPKTRWNWARAWPSAAAA